MRDVLFRFRIEQTIGKQSPASSDDRAKSTVLARMQRVEGSIHEMSQTMENIFILLKHLDEKFERYHHRASLHTVRFNSVDEAIP